MQGMGVNLSGHYAEEINRMRATLEGLLKQRQDLTTREDANRRELAMLSQGIYNQEEERQRLAAR